MSSFLLPVSSVTFTLIRYVPKSGATMTETTQETRSDIAITGNIDWQNSEVIPFAKAIGIKPMQVMSVPVSIGIAVARNA